MKERIYTIPLTEALDAGCECLLCHIEKQLNDKSVDYFIGPAMMEPDTRELTNKTGFCPRHYGEMLERGNKLSSALMLQTRFDTALSHLSEIENAQKDKQRAKLIAGYKDLFVSCAVCERVHARMSECVDNFVYLLKKEPDFRNRFVGSKGLCMKHFNMILPLLSGDLLLEVIHTQIRETKRLKAEIDKFCLKFDYRSADLDIEDVKDSPVRAAEKIYSCNEIK